MNIEKKFNYLDYSKNIFTRITLVNTLTLKEIDSLNQKYKELGLYIKQVRVDNFGREKSPNELLSDDRLLNKKRRSKCHPMTLQEFYNRYYVQDLKSPKKLKIEKKLIKSKNKIKYKKLDKNKNQSQNQSQNQSENLILNQYESENFLLESDDEEELKFLKNDLENIFNDCQKIEIKNCKISDEKFKEEIIKYIKEFSKYISKKQYDNLYKKWESQNMKMKGVDIFKNNDISNWKIPILKAFKSEISLLAFTNILGNKIGDKEENEDNTNENENRGMERDINNNNDDEDQSNSDEYSESNNFDNNRFDDNQQQINRFQQMAAGDEE